MASKKIHIRILIVCFSILLLFTGCAKKSSGRSGSDKTEKNKTAAEVLKEGQDEIEKKLAEVQEKNKANEELNLTLDTYELDRYKIIDSENPELYYPDFNTAMDDYSGEGYYGLNEVPERPRNILDMKDAIAEAKKTKDEKYLYKGRTDEVLFGIESINMCDSTPYKYIFGYCKPSKEVLYRTLENNKNIAEKYKAVFREQIDEWMDNNPGVDLTLLNENLYTLCVLECTQRQIRKAALSLNALACYRKAENTIYIEENSVMDDHLLSILKHEFAHAARTYIDKEDGNIYVMAGFYNSYYKALYADESLVTLFTSYENKAGLYPLTVNCYRILTECCDYTFNDYINHSVYELRDKVNYYLGDTVQADKIILGIESIGQYIYDPIDKAKYNLTPEKIKDVLEMIVKICIKTDPDVTAGEVFEKLNRDISQKDKYEEILTKEIIEELFEKASAELRASEELG